jgi:hypothetical protein
MGTSPARRPNAGLAAALAEAGGAAAPDQHASHLHRLLLEELAHGAHELGLKRSGYARPVAVALAATPTQLLAVAPVDPQLRADPGAVKERSWLVVAALVGALVDADSERRDPAAGALMAGALEGWLLLALPGGRFDDPVGAAELAVLAFEEQVGDVDRLRAVAYAVPAPVLGGAVELREPIGPTHPLRIAELVARLGGHPADERSVASLEDEVARFMAAAGTSSRPHEDPDPARRAARRIVQRLAGMGKWGGYHTSFDHLARGFAGNERALAGEVGERLLAAGLLLEKPSVGQRHVYLNSRRAREIYRFIDEGTVPTGLSLP